MGDMDSGNSGSLQSSSGGEDEYDSSRATAADSFSTFFNHHQIYAPTEGHHVTLGSYPNPPPPPPPPSFFDPLSTYFDHLSRSTNPSPVLNPDPVWLKDTNTIIRSDPSLIPTSSGPGLDHLPPSSSTTDKQISGGGARNPRKRTRASRRAPTTVLTTDTTNFRAMVQEFTGIPAPPFGSSAGSSSSLFFPRTRFDLFGNTRGAMDAPAPPYLLRPLAQKIQIPTLDTTTTTNKNSDSNADVMAASSSSGGNYHMDLGLLNLPFKYPGPEAKPAPGGSLELPVTITNINNNNNNNEEVQVGGPLGWAEGLGLGADAGAGAGGGSGGSRSVNMSAQHSHQRPQNLGFAHQQIG